MTSWLGQRYFHRATYIFFREAIPPKETIDHVTCDTPGCGNPSHTKAATMRENVLRGDSPSAKGARATHCPQGHEYIGNNIKWETDGSRKCRECCKVRKLDYYYNRLVKTEEWKERCRDATRRYRERLKNV